MDRVESIAKNIIIGILLLVSTIQYFEYRHRPGQHKWALTTCKFDVGGVVANHYVTSSRMIAGDCSDTHVRVDSDPPKGVNIVGVSVDTVGPNTSAKILLDQGEER